MLIENFEPTPFTEVIGPFATACGVSVPVFDPAVSLTDRELADLRRKYSGSLIAFDRLRDRLNDPLALLRTDEGGWSIREILGHMVDTDREIWWPRIETMLRYDEPFLESVDQGKLIDEQGWNDQSVEHILAQFMQFRWSAALQMNGLTDQDIRRKGRHYELGEMTVANVLQILVAHDAHFLAKLNALLGEAR